MKQVDQRSGSPRSRPVPPSAEDSSARSRAAWKLLLLLPFLALCFPALYARATPQWMGFPFFYWYQFLWVVLSSGVLAVVYRKLRF